MDTFSAQATCYARDDERLHTTLTSRTRQRLGLSLHMLLLALAPPAIWAQPNLDGCNPKATATDFQTAPISMCETSFDDESTVLASTCTAAAADDVCRMVRRGWWSAAKAYLPSVAEAERARIRKFMEAHRAGAASIVALLRQGKGSLGSTLDERTVVTPACQWAQNDSVVSLAVRFSPKKHGPVSVANVDEPSVDLNATHLTFGALARGKPLRFALELELEADILPDASSWSAGAAGRLTLTLTKAAMGRWARLAKPPSAAAAASSRPPPKITPWYEMQELLTPGSAAADDPADDTA